jgi:hypothetical protein
VYEHYIVALQRRLDEVADPAVKDWWENYVKGSAPFRGVKMPLIRAALHKWHAEEEIAAELSLAQQKDLALALFREEQTEDKLAGILFLQEILLPAGAIEWQPTDVLARIQSFAARARQQYAGQHVLAVTHGDPIAFTVLWCKGLPVTPDRGRLGLPGNDNYLAHASICTLVYHTAEEDEMPRLQYKRPY